MKHLRNADFPDILQEDGPSIVKFSAPWCAPCKAFAPIFEEVALDFPHIQFCEADIEDNDQLAVHLRVSKVPLIVLIEGNRVLRYDGQLMPSAFTKWIEENVPSVEHGNH